jgi:predicted ester cyclase
MNDPIAVMRCFVENYQSTGDETVAEQLLAPDFVDHTPFPGFGPGRQDVLALFRMLRGAFPDLRAEIEEQFAQGARVVTRKTFRGTH